MGNGLGRPRPARGSAIPSVPRGLRPYKQKWQSTYIAIFYPIFMIGITVGAVLGDVAHWPLMLTWLMIPCSTYCYFRERASRTVIPGVYWGLGQVLFALAPFVLLLVLA